MRVLYIAVECKPFSKVGGVADVAGELPPALRREGIDIEIATPLHRDLIGSTAVSPSPLAHWMTAQLGDVPVFLLDNPEHFNGPVYINSPKERPYWDDAIRFSFFSAACLDLIEARRPDIVHVNDWSLCYLLGLMELRGMPQARVLSVHNVQYQGNFWRGLVPPGSIFAQLDDAFGERFSDPHTEWDCVNPLRLGLDLAHMVNTVSPNYAREMTQTPDDDRFFMGGCGLEEIAREMTQTPDDDRFFMGGCGLEEIARAMYPQRLVGILNGFEYSHIGFAAALEKKTEARAHLAAEFTRPDDLLLGFVGRAVEQKIRLLAEELDGRTVLEHLLEIPGFNLTLVASGEPVYEEFLRSIPESRNGVRNFVPSISYDAPKARRIMRGCDVFLMPSLFEPCGITQMESMAMATPPLVRRTGGLADTVVPHTEPGGTGFVFDGDSRDGLLRALLQSVRDAAAVRRNPERFDEIQHSAFRQRFLWSTAATRYINEVYRPALQAAQ